MTDEESLRRGLERHGAFEPDDGAVRAETTAASATARPAADGSALELTVRLPTLDAVVVGETVAEVVRTGWLETFERRLEDLGGVARGDVAPATVRIDDREVVVETTVAAADPRSAADDAKAVIDSIEATWVQGLIPGYDYRAPASALLERARSAGER